MKKFSFILLYLSFTFTVPAQTDIGLQSNITRSRLNGFVFYKYPHNYFTGYSIGSVVNKQIVGHLSVASGLFFERTGSRVNDFQGEFSEGDIIYRMDHLSVPFFACYDFGREKSFGLGAGVFGSYLFSQKIIFDNRTSGRESYKWHDFKNLNAGLAAKVYYRFQFKNKLLVVGMEDHLGLPDVMSTRTPQEKTTTHSFGLFAAFQFRTGHKK